MRKIVKIILTPFAALAKFLVGNEENHILAKAMLWFCIIGSCGMFAVVLEDKGTAIFYGILYFLFYKPMLKLYILIEKAALLIPKAILCAYNAFENKHQRQNDKGTEERYRQNYQGQQEKKQQEKKQNPPKKDGYRDKVQKALDILYLDHMPGNMEELTAQRNFLLKRLHPDETVSDKIDTTHMAQEINMAYEVLKAYI